MAKERFEFVDIAKGICIILVALGHYNPPNAPEWYNYLVKFIYTFHMPVFMCMSGFLFYKGFRKEISFSSFILKKAKRLMIPYFSISIFLISSKLFIQYFIKIENPVTVSSFIEMFYTPVAGYFLWFMYALFVIFIIMFIILKYIKYGLLLISIISILIFTIGIEEIPNYCCLPQAFNMLPAFLLGCWIYKYHNILKYRKLIPFFLILHIVLFVVIQRFDLGINQLYFYNMLIGIIACVYISQLSFFLNPTKKICKYLIYIGIMSNAIYLFHTSVMALPKFLWLKYIGINTEITFIFSVLFIVLLGVVVPVFLKKIILKNKILSQLILGE